MTASDANADKEDLNKLSVAELKRRLSWRNALPAGASEKAELVAALRACPDVGGIFSGEKQQSKPPSAAAESLSGARSFGPGDMVAPDEEDFSKLSVGELKKRIRWVGATIPAGASEKSDLIAALKAAPGIHRPYVPVVEEEKKPEKPKEPPKKEESKKKLHEPKPVRALSQDEEETVNFMVLSEDELKRRIRELGGRVPDGEPTKFFLVHMLKKMYKERAPQRSEKDLAAEAEMKEMERALLEAAAEEEKREAAKAAATGIPQPDAVPAPPPPPPSTGELEDIAQLTTVELKRRLAEYGQDLSIGLTERSEFITALQRALINLPRPKTTGVPQAISEEDLAAQMAEMERTMQEQAENPDVDIAQAASAGEAAAKAAAKMQEAEKAKEQAAENAKRAADSAAGAEAKRLRLERKAEAARKVAADTAVVVAPKVTAAKKPIAKRPKAPPTGNEICLSDGEDEVVCTPGGAAAISLDVDDDNAEPRVKAPKVAVAAAESESTTVLTPEAPAKKTADKDIPAKKTADTADGSDGAWL